MHNKQMKAMGRMQGIEGKQDEMIVGREREEGYDEWRRENLAGREKVGEK